MYLNTSPTLRMTSTLHPAQLSLTCLRSFRACARDADERNVL